MNVAVVGLGLIGGSFEKASRRAGHTVAALHHGDETGFENADLVLVCLPPEAIVPWISRHATQFKAGCVVLDIAGVKQTIMDSFEKAFPRGTGSWTFVGGHPMAGREVSGYANALETLFDGASMILVPRDETDFPKRADLEAFFRSLGFARVVVTTAARHDAMIAFTSQLCHVIATAYSRDALVAETPGFSAGSYADMTRIATQDASIWSALYLSNASSLLPVLDRFMARLGDFRRALDEGDKDAMMRIIAEGAEAKRSEICLSRISR